MNKETNFNNPDLQYAVNSLNLSDNEYFENREKRKKKIKRNLLLLLLAVIVVTVVVSLMNTTFSPKSVLKRTIMKEIKNEFPEIKTLIDEDLIYMDIRELVFGGFKVKLSLKNEVSEEQFVQICTYFGNYSKKQFTTKSYISPYCFEISYEEPIQKHLVFFKTTDSDYSIKEDSAYKVIAYNSKNFARVNDGYRFKT